MQKYTVFLFSTKPTTAFGDQISDKPRVEVIDHNTRFTIHLKLESFICTAQSDCQQFYVMINLNFSLS